MPTISEAIKKRRRESKFVTPEYYQELFRKYNIPEPEPKKKISLFRKTIDILQRPNYAIAGFAGAFTKRGKAAGENPLQEAWDGLTGREKETFSDVLKDVGVENKYARAIAGFALDVVLDPTTYVGGFAVKGGLKLAKGVTKGTAAVGKRVGLREPIRFIEETGKTLGEALKKSFQYGYGTGTKLTKLTLGGKAIPEKELTNYVVKPNGVFKRAFDEFGEEILGKKVARVENGVIKTLKGKEQIGSFESIVGKTQAFFNKVLRRTDDYDLILEQNQKLFSKFDEKTLREAFDIVQNNTLVEAGLRKGGIKLGSGKVAEAVQLMKKKGKELGESLEMITGIKGKEWYAPFINKKYIGPIKKYSDTLAATRGDYAKKLKGLIAEEDIYKKPIEAYTRREFELTHDLLRQDALNNIIKAFGKKAGDFKSIDEAVAAGLKPIYRKGTKDVVGLAGTKKSAKLLGYLNETDARFVDNVLFPEFKTVDMLAKASGYDAFTSAFKQLVTAWFPAFHVRNMFSGYVQNYSVLGARAFDPRTVPQGITVLSKKLIDKAGMTRVGGVTLKEVREALIDRFGYSSRYVTDVDHVATALEAGAKFRKLSKVNPRRIGNWIEMNQKANATINALRQGKSLEEALNLAEKAGFDYSKITQFEAKVLRRLIPFYTFARKNAALQLSTFKHHPERILNQVKFTNMLSNMFGGGKPTEEELGGVPPWALNAMGFKIQEGKYISKFGLPMEEFLERVADPIKTSLSSMNPLVKYPLEAKSGYDFFREKPIKDITNVKEPTAKILTHEKTPKWIKEAFHVTSYVDKKGKKRYKADAENLHLLRNIPLSRFQNTADKMFADGITNVTPAKIASFLIGAQLYDIDIILQENFTEKDLIKAYQEELQSRGVIYDFTMFPESKTTIFDYKK